MSSVFITGASGFIGRHLARRLAAEGYSLKCLVRSTSARAHLEALDAELLPTNLLDAEGLTCDVAGCDYVFHVAGMTCAFNPQDLTRINGEGSSALAQACAAQPNPPTVVIVSSLSAAGPVTNGIPHAANVVPRPVSDYGKSKRAGEIAFERYAANVPTTILRPGIVFGEENTEMFPMFQSIRQTGLHALPGWKTPGRVCLIHVADLVELAMRAAYRGSRISKLPGEDGFTGAGYYFAADSQFPRYDDLGRMIQQAMGARRMVPVPVPTPILWTVGLISEKVAKLKGKPSIVNRDKAREGLAGDWIASPAQAQEELGFVPAEDLQTRLHQTAAWYQNHGWL